MTAINEYNRTTETINRSVKLSMVTSKAVNESIQRVSNLKLMYTGLEKRTKNWLTLSVLLQEKT